jgi:hypothetical protein
MRLDRLHIAVRFAILVAIGVWVVYCAHADEGTRLKNIGLTVGLAAFGLFAIEEGRIRERKRLLPRG